MAIYKKLSQVGRDSHRLGSQLVAFREKYFFGQSPSVPIPKIQTDPLLTKSTAQKTQSLQSPNRNVASQKIRKHES